MSINLATRALTTNQAVMQVIGHNIANANTDGYTRQRVELQAVPGQQLGSGYFGKGVQIEAVTRVGYDAFLTRESNTTKAAAAAESVRYAYLQNVESLFPMGEGGLGEILNNALNAWVDVANSPNDSTARQVVLSQFDALAARIRDTYARTQQIGESARLQATETANEVNRIAQAIANVNDAIARVQGSGASPNDLLDQRDRLVAQLNEKVQVTTLQADDGTLSIFVAGSLPLVLGSQAAKLQVTRADVDGDRQIKLQFVQGTSAYDVPTEFLGGGELKGLVDFINGDLIQTQAELGRVALAMADAINRQQRSGLRLDGQPGTDLFSLFPRSVLADPANSGTGTVDVSVVNASAVKTYDYELTFTGATDAVIRRTSDGKYWSGSDWQATPTPAVSVNGYSIDGLTFTLSGSPTAGDKLYVLNSSLAQASATNSGSSAVSVGVEDATGLKAYDYQLEFTSASDARIRRSSDGWYWNGTGWQSTAASAVPVNGYSIEGVRLSVFGAAAAGDQFLLKPAAAAASAITLALSSPVELAASSRVQIQSSLANTGNSTIESVSAKVGEAGWPSSLPPLNISFTGSGTFNVSAGWVASSSNYQPGRPMTLTYTDPGGSGSVQVEVVLRGQPNGGDQFTVAEIPSGPAAVRFNSGNAQAILGLRDTIMFDDSITLSDGYVSVFSGLASRVNEAQTRSTFAQAQADDAEQRRANQAGVNLDEEAARLLQFQQAYQASAKYLQTVQSIFDTLIATFR